jgi:hypothetical protein
MPKPRHTPEQTTHQEHAPQPSAQSGQASASTFAFPVNGRREQRKNLPVTAIAKHGRSISLKETATVPLDRARQSGSQPEPFASATLLGSHGDGFRDPATTRKPVTLRSRTTHDRPSSGWEPYRTRPAPFARPLLGNRQLSAARPLLTTTGHAHTRLSHPCRHTTGRRCATLGCPSQPVHY